MRYIVYCNAVKFGGEQEWDFIWERLLNANVGNEKEAILLALACSKEPWILNRYMERAITPHSGIRKQDSPSVFIAVAGNVVGENLSYRFLTSNWDRIKG